jgi:hypothetical protein
MCCPYCRPQTAKYLDAHRNLEIEKKLRDNDVPPPSEQDELRKIVEEGEQELKRLHDSLTLSMNQQTSELRSFLSRMKSLLSPIRNLPSDLLSKIFLMFVEDAGGLVLPTKNHTSIPPNILSSTCKFWRDLVLSTPSLWAELNITLKTGFPTAMLEIILSRSRTSHRALPLKLQISSSWMAFGPQSDEALKPLTRECSRWRWLSLVDPWNILSSLCFRTSISGYLPSLEHLKVSYSSLKHFGDVPLVISQHAPRLRTLQISEMGTHLTLPWSQFRSIQCSISTRVWENMALCKDAPTLSVSLHAKRLGSSAVNVGHGLDLGCRNLELDITGRVVVYDYSRLNANCTAILQGISSPHLRELKITDSESAPFFLYGDLLFFPLRPIRTLALQSGGKLRSLTIAHLPFHPNDSFSDFLSELPLLESLTIVELSDVTPPDPLFAPTILRVPLLEGFTVAHPIDENYPKTSTLCPRLTKLDFGVGSPPDHFSVSTFQKLVESRWLPDREVDGVVCLQEVIISSCHFFSDKFCVKDLVVRSLKSVQEKGMAISVGQHYKFVKHGGY